MSLYYYTTTGANADSDAVRLLSFNDTTNTLSSIATAENSPLQAATAITSDADGNFYVFSSVDTVLSFDSTLALRTTWATSGKYTISGTHYVYHMVVHPSTGQLLIPTELNAVVLDSSGAFDYNCTLPFLQYPYAGAQMGITVDGTKWVIPCKGGTYGCITTCLTTDGSDSGYWQNQAINNSFMTNIIAASGTFAYFNKKFMTNPGVVYKMTYPGSSQQWAKTMPGANDGVHIIESADASAIYTNEGTSIVKRGAADGEILFSYDCGSAVQSMQIIADDDVVAITATEASDEDAETGDTRVFTANLSKLATGTYGTSLYGVATGGASIPVSLGTESRYSKKLVSACQNAIWYGSSPDNLTKLEDSDGNIDCSEPLSLAEHTSKVFIANGANKYVADFGNSKISTSDILGGVGLPLHGETVTGDTSGAQMVVDYISASSGACIVYGTRLTTATFTAGEAATGTNADGDAVSFTLAANEIAGPHFYAWTPYANDSTTYGSLPAKVDKVFVSQGRVGVTLDRLYPHQWYLSRQLNPWNWVYGEDDAQSAVAGNNTDAGEVGDVLIDAFPYKDVYVIFGCASSFWYMTGNPCQGGSINELDLTSGLLGPGGWCWDDKDNLFAMTTKGLMRFNAGFTGSDNLTATIYPDFIKDLAFNRGTQRLVLSYDPSRNGVLISATTTATGASTNWWYSLVSGGLFPESYPNAAGMMCSAYFNADDPADTDQVYGGWDGYLRKFDPAAKSDDAGATDDAIDSYLSFGPIPMTTDARHDGTLGDIDIITGGGDESATAEDSDAITLTVFAERTAEQVIKSAVNNTNAKLAKVITGPGVTRGSVEKRRARGRAGVIKVRNATLAQSWALEHINFNIKKSGKVR